jgi:hypothetical protein
MRRDWTNPTSAQMFSSPWGRAPHFVELWQKEFSFFKEWLFSDTDTLIHTYARSLALSPT